MTSSVPRNSGRAEIRGFLVVAHAYINAAIGPGALRWPDDLVRVRSPRSGWRDRIAHPWPAQCNLTREEGIAK